MFERIHQKLGTAGFVIAILALVAALGGTAFAAAKLNGTQKKEVEKIAKKYAGAPGANGTAGPAGPVGPAGPKGDAGANGGAGAVGPTGPAGAKGATGATGATGLSGFTATLPSGKTETGTWSISQGWTGGTGLFPNTAISFPIPLAAGGGEGSAAGFNQKATEEEEFEASGCQGTVAEPTAPPGKLCVYTHFEEGSNAETGFVEPRALDGSLFSYGTSGATLFVGILKGNELPSKIEASGSWAVTAP
jgi:hypothetical protein